MYPKREATTSKLESNSINYFSARRYSLDGLKKIVGSVNRLRQSESEDICSFTSKPISFKMCPQEFDKDNIKTLVRLVMEFVD